MEPQQVKFGRPSEVSQHIIQSWINFSGNVHINNARHLQRFVSIHDPTANLFHFPRNALNATDYRTLRAAAMVAWHEISCVMLAA